RRRTRRGLHEPHHAGPHTVHERPGVTRPDHAELPAPERAEHGSRPSRMGRRDGEDRAVVEERDVDEVVVTRKLRIVVEGPLLSLGPGREQPAALWCWARRLVEGRRARRPSRRPVLALRCHVELPAAVTPYEIEVAPPLSGSGGMLLQRVGPDTDCPRAARAPRRPKHEKGRLVSADAGLATRKL